MGADAFFVEHFGDLRRGVTLGIGFEDHPDDGRRLFIDDEMLLFIDGISEGIFTDGLTFLNGGLLAAADVLGELKGIIFREAFQNGFQDDAFRRVGNGFRHIFHADAVLFAFRFIDGDFFAIAAEAIDLPADDDGEMLFCGILEHLLEFGAVIRAAGLGAVDIFVNDIIAMIGGEFVGFGQLTFDGLFALGMGTVPRVDYGVFDLDFLVWVYIDTHGVSSYFLIVDEADATVDKIVN